MQYIAVIPRIFSKILGEFVDLQEDTTITYQMDNIDKLFPWKESEQLSFLLEKLKKTKYSISKYDYSVLFEGQGVMEAPPWGSVYLDKDNLVMGDTTENFSIFLNYLGIALDIKQNEPIDHISIMFATLAYLIENGKNDDIATLLEKHMLPWAYRYFELLGENKQSEFYATIAKICNLFLLQIEKEMYLDVCSYKLYV